MNTYNPEGYWYEHANGTFIFKPDLCVEAMGGPELYFVGPFVKRWWRGNRDDKQPVLEGVAR